MFNRLAPASVIFLATIFSLPIPVLAAQLISEPAGQSIVVSQPVNDTIFLVGNHVEISSSVTGDVFIIGQTVKITGPITQNLFVAANSLTIDGAVTGDIFALTSSLVLEDQATITKNIYLFSPQLTRKPGASVLGQIITPDQRPKSITQQINAQVLATLALLAVGAALIYFFPKSVQKIVVTSTERWGAAILWGLIGSIVIPIVATLLIVIRVGLPIGLILLTFYVIDLYLSTIIIGTTVGQRLTNGRLAPVWTMALGVVFIQILRLIPGVRGLISLAVIIWGFGSIILGKKGLAEHFRHDL